ncbi:hypothetical protein FXO38_28084 [Capsicum annuum]|nr:hypothetical protein FXO38_28084 [Capsicum annuum]KAF3663115.1 hypothetical protein FXO37_12134 [Capsicum annuum]
MNFSPNFAPFYYNQSGPVLPILCNLFNPDLTSHNCGPAEVDLDNATQVLNNYVCQVSPSGICITPGRLTPTLYSQMAAAVNMSSGLYHYSPFLVELQNLIAALVVKTNLVSNKTEWMLDTGDLRHFCVNKELFHDFEESTNDECIYMGNFITAEVLGAISWKSSKQTCIACSTMKSEFITVKLTGQEAEWLRNLLTDVPLWGRQVSPVSLHCDSQATIEIAKNSVYNSKKRHIRIRYDLVKQLLKDGVISLEYVRSERNLADPMIKV